MAAIGLPITVGTTATLIFEVVDAVTYAGLSSPGANIFVAREPSDPLPLLLVVPTGVYLGGSDVTVSGGTTGCQITAATIISYNATASDSLYGVVGSDTASVGLLAQRQ